jgi:hypothetical protein
MGRHCTSPSARGMPLRWGLLTSCFQLKNPALCFGDRGTGVSVCMIPANVQLAAEEANLIRRSADGATVSSAASGAASSLAVRPRHPASSSGTTGPSPSSRPRTISTRRLRATRPACHRAAGQQAPAPLSASATMRESAGVALQRSTALIRRHRNVRRVSERQAQ